MITFEECQIPGYRDRTIINASADITLAFAKDFTSAGERLTRTSVLQQGKKYFSIQIEQYWDSAIMQRVDPIVRSCLGYSISTINIAGNGIYTMKNYCSQIQCDNWVYQFLILLLNHDMFKPIQNVTLIRSGGQTGFDEAGLKAAVKLGIPAHCLAPKGWVFRDINGKDIANEKQFKARFL